VSAYYKVGMRVRAVAPTPGTISGTITAVAYSAPNTLVTVLWDGTGLSNEAITAILIGIGSGPGGGAAVGASPPVYTQCRLDYVSSSVIRLNRSRGSLLTIDNVPQTIPASGVDLGPGGLTPATNVNIYAYMSGGAITLEASATGVVTDPRNGIYVKSGDASRSFIGRAWVTGGPAWQFTSGVRGLMSYYNRIRGSEAVNAGGSTSSGTNVGIGNIFYCMTESDAANIVSFQGNVADNNTANAAIWGLWYGPYGGSMIIIGGGEGVFSAPGINYGSSASMTGPIAANILGLTAFQLYARVSPGGGSTATFGGGLNVQFEY
jgi:hypothetical protein